MTHVKDISMTPVEALKRCGQALHGRDWIRPTSNTVGMHQTTFSKWKSGKIPNFRHDHSVFPVLIYKMREKAAELRRIADETEKWIANKVSEEARRG